MIQVEIYAHKATPTLAILIVYSIYHRYKKFLYKRVMVQQNDFDYIIVITVLKITF